MTPDLEKTLGPMWVVKILDGASPRQSEPLSAGRVSIGHAYANDIVLRDRGAKGCRAILSLGEDQAAQVQILEGEARLLGQILTSPAVAFLPAYVPLSLGEVHLAHGQAGDPRWEDARRLLQAMRGDPATFQLAPSEPTPGVADGVLALTKRMLAPILSYTPPLLCCFACCFAVMAATGKRLGVAHASPAAGPVRPAAAGPGATTGRVEDVFMSAGVKAVAVIDGRRGLTVSVPKDADPLIVDEARRRVLRETPGLKQLAITFADTAMDSASSPPRDGAKRIVAAVSGAEGYLTAADGSKYFVGAQLPTGQVLKSIDRNLIEFEEGGVTTQIHWQDEGDQQ